MLHEKYLSQQKKLIKQDKSKEEYKLYHDFLYLSKYMKSLMVMFFFYA